MFKPTSIRLRAAHDAAGCGLGDTTPVLDEASLDKLRQLDPGGRRGFLPQVLSTYLKSLEHHLAQLATLAEGAGPDALRPIGEIAHTLKSSSASIGALRFARHCATVEQGARAGDSGVMAAPLGALRAEGERVRAAVRAMLPP